MKKKQCGIYKITNLKNGKVYIGQAVDIVKRWRDHRENYLTHDEVVYRAMRKYGLDNFAFDILEECCPDRLDEKEIYYIKQYRSYIGWKDNHGYNMTEGGGGRRGFFFSKETRKKMSLAKVGRKMPLEQKELMREISKHTCVKGVVQYSREGEYIATFESVNEAGRRTGTKPACISHCCNNESVLGNGFQWKFLEEAELNNGIPIDIQGVENTSGSIRNVKQFSLDGVLIAVYSNLTEAQLATGIIRQNISACCKGKRKTAGGFKWKYEN